MIKKIEVENFLSAEEIQYRFADGITLIEGWNFDDGRSEGAGKSLLPNALAWGLFGQLPKPIAVGIDDVIREGQKSCQVMIELEDGIRIVRKRGPNELYLYDSV